MPILYCEQIPLESNGQSMNHTSGTFTVDEGRYDGSSTPIVVQHLDRFIPSLWTRKGGTQVGNESSSTLTNSSLRCGDKEGRNPSGWRMQIQNETAICMIPKYYRKYAVTRTRSLPSSAPRKECQVWIVTATK